MVVVLRSKRRVERHGGVVKKVSSRAISNTMSHEGGWARAWLLLMARALVQSGVP